MNNNIICVSKKSLLGFVAGIIVLSAFYFFGKTFLFQSPQSKAAEKNGCTYSIAKQCIDAGYNSAIKCSNGKYICITYQYFYYLDGIGQTVKTNEYYLTFLKIPYGKKQDLEKIIRQINNIENEIGPPDFIHPFGPDPEVTPTDQQKELLDLYTEKSAILYTLYSNNEQPLRYYHKSPTDKPLSLTIGDIFIYIPRYLTPIK